MKVRLGLLVVAGLLACTGARADRVLLDNGDRYSGKVQSLTGGVLSLQSEFGPLELPWSRVTGLQTDRPLRLTLQDGAQISGAIETRDGRLGFPADPALSGVSVPLQSVLAAGPIEPPPTLTVEARTSAGLNVSRGNTETESYHVDAELIVRSTRDRYTVSALGNYGTDGDRQISGDASAQARYDHFISERWYFNSNLGAAHDKFRDLRLRTTLGVGAGYQFKDSERSRLSAELGISYVHEDFHEAADEEQPAARWALDFQHRFGLSGLLLFHRHELFAGLERTEDVLLRSQTGVRVPLFGRLSGGAEINFDYDWEPPADAESADTLYLLKLIYEI